jgi:hypothetical protein
MVQLPEYCWVHQKSNCPDCPEPKEATVTKPRWLDHDPPPPEPPQDTLLQRYANVMEQLDALSEARLDLEAEIIASMSRDGATEWVDGPHTAKLKQSRSYVQDKLTPILEIVPEDDLVAAKAYTPEHEETILIKAKWDVRKTMPFAKRGKAIQDVIDDASIKGTPKLRVETKTLVRAFGQDE